MDEEDRQEQRQRIDLAEAALKKTHSWEDLEGMPCEDLCELLERCDIMLEEPDVECAKLRARIRLWPRTRALRSANSD